MNYQEVIKHINNVEQKSQFIAIAYDESDSHFYTYLISANDDLDIGCQVEGGIPFHSDGVEDFLDIKEAVPLIDKLKFKPIDNYSEITCLNAEHVLFKLFPMLPNPEDIWISSEQQNFINLAKAQVENY